MKKTTNTTNTKTVAKTTTRKANTNKTTAKTNTSKTNTKTSKELLLEYFESHKLEYDYKVNNQCYKCHKVFYKPTKDNAITVMSNIESSFDTVKDKVELREVNCNMKYRTKVRDFNIVVTILENN